MFYRWILLPFLIFIARVLDVSLGTIRVIFISKGMKYLAPIIGFFEVLIWIIAIGQIMNNLDNPLCYIAYASGFALGNYVGIIIAEKLSLGNVILRVMTQKNASELIDLLKNEKYGVTCVDGQGAFGKVNIIFTIVRKREVAKIVNIVKKFNPKAFYTVEEIGFVKEGVLPAQRDIRAISLQWLMRPFRKGK